MYTTRFKLIAELAEFPPVGLLDIMLDFHDLIRRKPSLTQRLEQIWDMLGHGDGFMHTDCWLLLQGNQKRGSTQSFPSGKRKPQAYIHTYDLSSVSSV